MAGAMSGWRRMHREVRAQARQRCAQLVAGILHEPLLLGARQGERAEHPAERRPEAADLVAAGARHLDVETARRARRPRPPSSVAAPVRSPFRRSTSRAPPRPATPRTTRISVRRADVVEHGIDLVERPRRSAPRRSGAPIVYTRYRSPSNEVVAHSARAGMPDELPRRIGDRHVAVERRRRWSRRRASRRRTA